MTRSGKEAKIPVNSGIVVKSTLNFLAGTFLAIREGNIAVEIEGREGNQ